MLQVHACKHELRWVKQRQHLPVWHKDAATAILAVLLVLLELELLLLHCVLREDFD